MSENLGYKMRYTFDLEFYIPVKAVMSSRSVNLLPHSPLRCILNLQVSDIRKMYFNPFVPNVP